MERSAVAKHQDGDHHINQRLTCESLKIMKKPTNFNREDGYEVSNTWRVTLQDRRRNYNTVTDAVQRSSKAKMVYNEEQKTTTPVFGIVLKKLTA